MEALKVVLDTKVVIAAAINPPFRSSGKVMDLVVRGEVLSYTSEAILEELRFKLTSEKVLRYLESRVYALWFIEYSAPLQSLLSRTGISTFRPSRTTTGSLTRFTRPKPTFW